jgi:hypothetical protein
MVQIRPRSRSTTHQVDNDGDNPRRRVMALLEAIANERPEWMSDPRRGCAAIATRVFYNTDVSVALCEDCPFREACYWYAIDNNEEFGVWGGATPAQRRRNRKVMGYE